MTTQNDLIAFNRDVITKKKKKFSQKVLTPLKGTGQRKHFDFAVADIEAGNWIDFCCIGFYHELFKEYKYFESIHDFLEEVYVYAEFANITNIFCHNGGKYDFSFIIQEAVFSDRFEVIDIIDRGSSFLSFKIVDIHNFEQNKKDFEDKKRPKIFELSFWDSLALLPFSLKSLCHSFKVPTIKGDIDYIHIPEIFTNNDYRKKLFGDPEKYTVFHKGREIKKFNENHKKSDITYYDKEAEVLHLKIYNKTDLKKYLKDDCVALSQVLTKFYDLPPIKKVGPALTIASQSIKVWRSYLNRPIPVLPEQARKIALEGFYGGRTEMFRPMFSNNYDIENNPIKFSKATLKEFAKQQGQELYGLDKNSLYPSCMRKDMPIKFIGKVKSGDKINIEEMGIYKCRVYVPDYLNIPPLPYRFTDPKTKQESLIFPVGTFTGTWTTYELRYAVSLGCKILKSFGGIKLQNGGPIFKSYVEDLYKMRLQAKADGNEPLQLTLKLLMNNTYGRLGLKLGRTTLELDRGQTGCREHSTVKDPKTGKRVKILQRDVVLENVHTNEAIPAWITSIARVTMHKEVIMKAGYENCFYMDTDSLYTTVLLPHSKAIGDLDLEDTMDSGVFILPKTYVLDGIKGKEYKIKHRAKGFAARKVKHFTTEDFMNQFAGNYKEGEEILKVKSDPKFATMKTALGKGFFLAMENDPKTNKQADKNRIESDQNELNFLNNRFGLLERENASTMVLADLEDSIKKLEARIRSRNKKLTGEYGVSYRRVKAKYNKRIISDDLMFTYPIKLEL